MTLELKDLIDIGFRYKNIKFEEFDNIDISDEGIEITDELREWFFNFFNNFNYINDKGFDDRLDEVLNNKVLDKNYVNLIEFAFKNRNKFKKEVLINQKDLIELIKKKNEINQNNFIEYSINVDYEYLNFGKPIFFKSYDLFKKDNYLINYFENDNNFDIYFTFMDLLKSEFSLVNDYLDKLNFRKFKKIIYINEFNDIEKLEKNPFRNIIYLNSQRVIKYYNTFTFNLYESVDSWLNNQIISEKFKKQPKLKKFLEIIVSFINFKNILIYFNDGNFNIKKFKIMLNLFNPNKFVIIDDHKVEVNNDNKIQIYKETSKKIDDYITCELNNEIILYKEREIKKNLNDFKKYFLPELLKDNNNIDLNLLIYFMNNPKNNENILSSLMNKYKNIL